MVYSTNYQVMAGVDLDPAVASVTLDLQADPGRTVSIQVVDPEGRPLGETVASGLFDDNGVPCQQILPTLEVLSLDPSRPRRVIVRHEGRKLIGSVRLSGDESGSRELKLRPWGTLTGRLVDDEGGPIAGVALQDADGDDGEPPAGRGILPVRDSVGGIQSGPDGRFRVEGLVPGLRYGASIYRKDLGNREVFRDETVGFGEVRDLGDLSVGRAKRVP